MITLERKAYLRGRAGAAQTWKERQAEQEAERRVKLEALKIRRALEEFSDRLWAYGQTPEGQARAQELRDREYDAALAAYRSKQHESQDFSQP